MIKFKDILEESVLTHRRSKEDRENNYKKSIYKYIDQYIKNGSKGDLKLTGLKVDIEFPDDLKRIDGDFYIDGSVISTFPKNLTYVLLDVYLHGNRKIQSLGKLKTAYSIHAYKCESLSKLPDNLIVKSTLDLNGSGIKLLPTGLKCSTLDITNTSVDTIPSDINAKTILAAGSKLKYIDKNIKLNYLSLVDTPFIYDKFYKDGVESQDIQFLLKEYFLNVDYIYA